MQVATHQHQYNMLLSIVSKPCRSNVTTPRAVANRICNNGKRITESQRSHPVTD